MQWNLFYTVALLSIQFYNAFHTIIRHIIAYLSRLTYISEILTSTKW